MKKTILFILLSILFFHHKPVKAQDSIVIPDTLAGWQTSWEVGLNGSQASYSNWAQGGVNNISATGATTYSSLYREGRFGYGILINLRYGKSQIDDEGTRKIDDRLYIQNRFLYDLGDEGSIFTLFSNIRLRTQFDKGYDYDANEDGSDRLISRFFAPAYFTEDIGLAYIPNDNFTYEMGFGLQQTYVADQDLAPLYGFEENENFRSESGLTIGASYQIDLAENLTFGTNLNTFTNVGKALSSTDIHFNNKLVGRINSFMNATLNLDFVYDDDYSEDWQVAQVLSLGVSFNLR